MPISVAQAVRRVSPTAHEYGRAIRQVFPLQRQTYSQSGEDLILKNYLPEAHGQYLDIGSSHPIYLSNTYMFYRGGWSGVLVDPLRANRHLSQILRRRDTFVQAVATSTAGSGFLYEFDPSFYSTMDETVAKERQQAGLRLTRVSEVQGMPVHSMPFHVHPLMPSLVSIDVEGNELDCLQSFNWDTQAPRVIVVELWENEMRRDDNQIVRDFLETRGYEETERCGVDNVFWVHSAYARSQR